MHDAGFQALVRCRIACTLIAQKSYDAAGLELASIPPQQHNSLYHLYDSLLKFTGDLELSSIVRELKEDFAQINISELPAFDRVWYRILQALIAEINADMQMAETALIQAQMESQQFTGHLASLYNKPWNFCRYPMPICWLRTFGNDYMIALRVSQMAMRAR